MRKILAFSDEAGHLQKRTRRRRRHRRGAARPAAEQEMGGSGER